MNVVSSTLRKYADTKDDEVMLQSILREAAEELAERSDIINAIDPYVKQMRYEFICGKKSIDSGWDSYIKELKGLNIDRLNEINNAAYKRMK